MFAALDMVLEDIIKNNNKYAFIILPGAEVDPILGTTHHFPNCASNRATPSVVVEALESVWKHNMY
ncbi:hypothetical protein HKD37_02G005101 [Glycine soja]